MSVALINVLSKEKREIPTGFSWTSLLFGVFVPFIRGMIAYGFLAIFLCIGSFGVGLLIYPFVINKHYLKHLLTKGWMLEEDYKDQESRRNREDLIQEAVLGNLANQFKEGVQ